MRVVAVQLNPVIGDLDGNTKKIVDALHRAKEKDADVVLFSELIVTGYPPEDLLLDPGFINAALEKLGEIAPATRGLFAVVGVPRWNPTKVGKPLHNSAAIFRDGKLEGFYDKILLPTYDVFDEMRYFEPGERRASMWTHQGVKIAVTICEDLWQHSKSVSYTNYVCDPVLLLKELRPDLLLNASASPYHFRKRDTRSIVFGEAARTLQCPVIQCNQVGANDQLIFDGNSFYLSAKGELMQRAAAFAEGDLIVDLKAEACPCPQPVTGIRELYSALVLGVRDYFHKQRFRRAILGLSGGIDSALTACIAADALGAHNVSALFLPTRYSSAESRADALQVAHNLNVELKVIDIDPIFENYLALLEPHFEGLAPDIMEENLQSRIRAMVLMAFSNKQGTLLLTTGNKSEMAMGYTTLYGDMAGGLAVLHDVVKLHVYELARLTRRIPESILVKAPSPELRPAQKTVEALHPFETLDPLIEAYVEKGESLEDIAKQQGLSAEVVRSVVHRIHKAEYKRRQAPISLRVTQKAFSKGRSIPIVQSWR